MNDFEGQGPWRIFWKTCEFISQRLDRLPFRLSGDLGAGGIDLALPVGVGEEQENRRQCERIYRGTRPNVREWERRISRQSHPFSVSELNTGNDPGANAAPALHSLTQGVG